jgi:hypothetical protein
VLKKFVLVGILKANDEIAGFESGSGYGSGSADPCFWLMDPDSDSDLAIFVINFQDDSPKTKFWHNFFPLVTHYSKGDSF